MGCKETYMEGGGMGSSSLSGSGAIALASRAACRLKPRWMVSHFRAIVILTVTQRWMSEEMVVLSRNWERGICRRVERVRVRERESVNRVIGRHRKLGESEDLYQSCGASLQLVVQW